LINKNNINVTDKNEKIATQTQNQSVATRSKNDTTVDNNTCNAAMLLGKIAQSTIHSRDIVDNCGNRETMKNPVQRKPVEEDEDDDDDNDDDKADDNNNENEDDNNNSNDEISENGFSDGSSETHNAMAKYNNRKPDDDNSITRFNVRKQSYADELLLHGRNDSVAMDIQLIKGVLPDIFAVLKILESNDDLVSNRIICRYFIKKFPIAESKQNEWWKQNSNAVRKSIGGRRASVSNLIKCSFMGTYFIV